MTTSTITSKVKRLDRVAWGITILVWLLVGAMRRIKFDVGIDTSFLAGLNALCNTGVTLALIAAFIFIKKGQVERHRKSIYTAMVMSAGFLISYVGYHFTNEEIVYCQEGGMRSLYYAILFSHIVLAGLSLPFILMTFVRGFSRDDVNHRKMAKWVFPVWLYVAATGPLVYLMLWPCR
jgi:putative membrane protein